MSDWPDEETDKLLPAGHRNFYGVKKSNKDRSKVDCTSYAGSSPEEREKFRCNDPPPSARIRLTIRRQTRILE